MRVTFHDNDIMVEFEEVDENVHLLARDHSTGFELKAVGKMATFGMFQEFKQISQAVIDGVKPQLAAAQRKKVG